ncbi:MAG: hypothetical protein ABFE01_26785 [Phycisphaerales bacterium]|jgi:glucan phosphoethanolaminetransferase (alkaline phosphatase superfamily)
MPFQFYSNVLSRASRSFASGVLAAGLLLIGFGVLILALPKVFAFLAAMVFFLAGTACATFAIKIFWVQRRIDRLHSPDDQDAGRINVRIHTDHRDEF